MHIRGNGQDPLYLHATLSPQVDNAFVSVRGYMSGIAGPLFCSLACCCIDFLFQFIKFYLIFPCHFFSRPTWKLIFMSARIVLAAGHLIGNSSLLQVQIMVSDQWRFPVLVIT